MIAATDSRTSDARVTIAFRLNGRPVEVVTSGARRLVDVLRLDFGLTGTKEGCSEGECGACTVLVDGDVVASCLVPVAQVAGRIVLTVEGLGTWARPAIEPADPDDRARRAARSAEPDAGVALDPLQQAFLEAGAVQCGMCTPGMLLAARAYLDRGGSLDGVAIREAIAGNLCRCTGYVKIVDAIGRAVLDAALHPADLVPSSDHMADPTGVRRVVGAGGGDLVLRPGTLDEAIALVASHAGRPIAGGTDVMVERATIPSAEPRPLIDLGGLAELRGIEMARGELVVGAATTFAELRRSPVVRESLPILADVAAQVGAAQIQNRGTIGGNVVTASPAGDLLPLLLAIDALIDVAGPRGARTIPADSFWTGYRQTALAADELLVRVRIPLIPGREVRFRKVGTRRAQAIAKVSLAVAWRSDRGAWHGVRIGLGAVAERPIRASAAEAALEGQVPGEATAERAARAVEADARPIDDIRSTATYRRTVTGRILRRIVLDAIPPC